MPESKKVNKVKKLICDIKEKKKICYSYKSFKTSTKQWIKVKKGHRIIHFKQKAWLRTYVDMNTELRITTLRKNAKN